MRPRVKICGVTKVEDALVCAELGADYVGLNFHPPSPRCVALEQAKRIARAVEGQCGVVAVMVGAPRRRVSEIVDEVGPDLVQFHGDETPGEIEPWSERALKVLRIRELPERQALRDFDAAWGFLFDTLHRSLPGGTGETWRWADLGDLGITKPVFVAGGIEPANARQALAASRAFGIDVCSGVESAPGRKSRRRLERLFAELNSREASSGD